MKFLVCLKQVPDSTVRVKVAPDGKSVATDGITWSISPYDEYAIELALEHKDADPATVVSVVAVGPARSRDAHATRDGCTPPRGRSEDPADVGRDPSAMRVPQTRRRAPPRRPLRAERFR